MLTLLITHLIIFFIKAYLAYLIITFLKLILKEYLNISKKKKYIFFFMKKALKTVAHFKKI